MTPLFFVGLTQNIWEQYQALYQRQSGLALAAPPPQGIYAVDATERLVLGVGLYPTEGQFLVVEHLVVDEGAAPDVRHLVWERAIQLMLGIGASMGKVVCCFPWHADVAKRLEHWGFRQTNAVVMVANPVAPVAMAQVELRAPEGRKPPEGRTATEPKDPATKRRVSKKKAKVKRKRRRQHAHEELPVEETPAPDEVDVPVKLNVPARDDEHVLANEFGHLGSR